MFNLYKEQNDVLEIFRIKAHLRSYVKDPIVVDSKLLREAVTQLKKLPYEEKDPSDLIARELVLKAYRLGYFKYNDLTDDGCKLVRRKKCRRHKQQQTAQKKAHSDQLARNRYSLTTI